ncbi:MAG: GntR family transcriptional regulator [Eubacteriales bacterium]|nr:GntR family transcriptional regulator [Eubacteriales bacterium]
MDFDPKRPIYDQLLSLFRREILSGRWPKGTQIPAVRSLAQEYKVNANTVQRALSELEREGLSFTQRTSGRFVTLDEKLLAKQRQSAIEEAFAAFLSDLEDLQIPHSEALKILTKELDGGSN